MAKKHKKSAAAEPTGGDKPQKLSRMACEDELEKRSLKNKYDDQASLEGRRIIPQKY